MSISASTRRRPPMLLRWSSRWQARMIGCGPMRAGRACDLIPAWTLAQAEGMAPSDIASSASRPAESGQQPAATAITAEAAAKHLGMTTGALAALRSRGGGPAYIKSGRTVRYLPADILAWWEQNRVEPAETDERTRR